MAIKQNGSHNFVTLASSGFLLQHAPVELVIFFYLLNSCHKRRWLWGLPTFPCGHGLICFPRGLLAPPNVKKCLLVQLSSVRLDISWQLLLLQLLQVLLMSDFQGCIAVPNSLNEMCVQQTSLKRTVEKSLIM